MGGVSIGSSWLVRFWAELRKARSPWIRSHAGVTLSLSITVLSCCFLRSDKDGALGSPAGVGVTWGMLEGVEEAMVFLSVPVVVSCRQSVDVVGSVGIGFGVGEYLLVRCLGGLRSSSDGRGIAGDTRGSVAVICVVGAGSIGGCSNCCACPSSLSCMGIWVGPCFDGAVVISMRSVMGRSVGPWV